MTGAPHMPRGGPRRPAPLSRPRCHCPANSLRLSGQSEIVTMDHLVAAAIAEDGFDLGGAPACDALGILGAIGCEPARDLTALAVAHQHGIAALEPSVDLAYTGRQQTLALAQRLHRTGVYDKRTFRLQH